jgi:hypothetical protein
MIFALAADGGSDRALMPILDWSLKRAGLTKVSGRWVDFSRIPHRRGTTEQLQAAIELYPCDILFIHRDAEGEALQTRQSEIEKLVRPLPIRHVPVIPVRMTEAWMLADPAAIRKAAGNPNGDAPLNLPDVRKLEQLPNPKSVLHKALTLASGRNARRRTVFPVHRRVHLVPQYTEDFSPLDVLPAFQAMQHHIAEAVAALDLAAQDA